MSQSTIDERFLLTGPLAFWGKWLSRGSLALFWILLLVATHWPPTADPPQDNPFDKVFHFVAYAGLGFLLSWVLSLRSPMTWQRATLIVAACSLAAALDEITQPWTGRNTDLYDWYADVAGVVAGLILFLLLSTAVRRRDGESETTTT